VEFDRADRLLGIFRDTIIVLLGTFMLVFETVGTKEPNALVIGAGLACFGLPPVLRLDLRSSAARRRREQNGRNGDDYEDRWSHLE
jgi:hypothetical protein